MIRRLPVRFAAAVLCLALTASAHAASKIAIAAVGDGAPGGGVFTGPSFVGEPSAAGNGWIASRVQVVTDNSATEQIVVSNMVSRDRKVAASVGFTISKEIGKIKQFMGRPTVNAHGDVAFAAVITPPDTVKLDITDPTPAGIFVFMQADQTIQTVAPPGLDTGIGILDLTTPVDLASIDLSAVDLAERTPALNDNGDVAFLASTLVNKRTQQGAIFLRRVGQTVTPVAKLGDPYADGKFQILGPPALNNSGTLAFRGLTDATEPLDGVFKLDGSTLTLLLRDGPAPPKLPAPFSIDPIFEFGTVVAMNDAGDVACTAGPFFDNSDNASLDNIDGSPGVILIHDGAPLLVGFPGQEIPGRGKLSDLVLGPEQGSRPTAPSLLPDGKVVFFSQLNSGSSQVIVRADPVARTLTPLFELGGPRADESPVGGTYLLATSAPAVDTAGAVVFSARLEGATTSQGVFYEPPAGPRQAITTGEPAPDKSKGYFGGPSFFPPQMNDKGDIVFKSYVAGGPALGFFRWRDGKLDALVRIRDTAPLTGAPPFGNLVGDASLNASGDIAFAATVAAKGRGVFATSGSTLRAIAMPQDELVPPDPKRPGAFFRTVASNPSLSDSGAVAFRGGIQYANPIDPIGLPDEKRDCVFLSDTSGIRIIAVEGVNSGSTPELPFFSFRDPVILGGAVLFRAGLGRFQADMNGLFLSDSVGVRPVAVENQDLGGGMTLVTLSGKAAFDEAGQVYFAGKVRTADNKSHGAILRRTPAGFETIALTGAAGPQGGVLRSFGRATVSSNGLVAFRANFDPGSGGVTGLFVAMPDGLLPYLRVGEGGAASVNGRIATFNQNVALNADDRVASLATLGGATAPSAILLAAPAKLRVGSVNLKRGPGLLSDKATGKPKDSIRVTASLQPGDLPTPKDEKGNPIGIARKKAVTVAVADTKGTLWSGTVAGANVQLRGRTLAQKGGAKNAQVRGLQVAFRKDGSVRVSVRSAPFDLTFTAGGNRKYDNDNAVILEPPLNVRVDVGEDGASAVVQCTTKGRRVRCQD